MRTCGNALGLWCSFSPRVVDLVRACKCASEAKSRGRHKGIRIADAQPLDEAETNKHDPEDHQRVVAVQHDLCGEPGREREGKWEDDIMSWMYVDEAAGAPQSCTEMSSCTSIFWNGACRDAAKQCGSTRDAGQIPWRQEE
jgi:hypothetical protein